MIVKRICPQCKKEKDYIVLHNIRKNVPRCDDCQREYLSNYRKKYQKTDKYKKMNRKRCEKWRKTHREYNKKYQRDIRKWKKYKIKMMSNKEIVSDNSILKQLERIVEGKEN